MTALRGAARALTVPLFAGLALTGVGVIAAPAASALPCAACRPGGDPGGSPGGPHRPPPPPPPANYPFGFLDSARESTSLNTVEVTGWTADADAPTSPLYVRVIVDGTVASTTLADGYRPDVASAFPGYGAFHGYDVTIPASNSGHNICITAVNVGSGGDRSLGCQTEDTVTGFTGYGFSYDTAHAVISNTTLDELDRVVNTNATTVTQNTEVDGTKAVADVSGWSDTEGVKVTLSASVEAGIPFIAGGKVGVSVEGDASFTQNGSQTVTHTFGWKQPVVVPPKSQVVADITVSRSTVAVPYTMTGDFVYASGAMTPGSVTGTYQGVSSHDLIIGMHQYDLSGKPAVIPVRQPAAKVLTNSSN